MQMYNRIKPLLEVQLMDPLSYSRSNISHFVHSQ